MNTTYTFLLTWENNTNSDSTEFCAKDQNEVKSLFKDFIKENPDTKPIGSVQVETVYNEEDAKEYGADYFAGENCPKTYTFTLPD